VTYFGSSSLILLLYLFPTGLFVPNWTRLVSIGWPLWNAQILLGSDIITSSIWNIAYIVVLALGTFTRPIVIVVFPQPSKSSRPNGLNLASS